MAVLKEFLDVFAWTPSDLTGISLKLGEHHIDLIDGSVPIRQRQYKRYLTNYGQKKVHK